MTDLILIPSIFIAVFFAALFAGSETGMYQLNVLRLRLGIEKKKFSFVMLGKVMRDGQALLVSTLLCTNLAHYITTTFITYFFLDKLKSEQAAQFFATVITAPVLFIFAEVIPKNLFFYRADSLMPRVSVVLFIVKKLFTYLGIVAFMKFLSKTVLRFGGPAQAAKAHISTIRSPYIKAIIHDTRKEGFLSPVQVGIINRMAHIGHLKISAVMTPFNKIEYVNINSGQKQLLHKLEHTVFTRMPVYENTRDNIVGFIDIYQCLSAQQPFDSLKCFLQPIEKLSADTNVTDAIDIMRKNNQKIVLIVRHQNKKERPVGLVTMKDLAEELLGEIAEW